MLTKNKKPIIILCIIVCVITALYFLPLPFDKGDENRNYNSNDNSNITDVFGAEHTTVSDISVENSVPPAKVFGYALYVDGNYIAALLDKPDIDNCISALTDAYAASLGEMSICDIKLCNEISFSEGSFSLTEFVTEDRLKALLGITDYGFINTVHDLYENELNTTLSFKVTYEEYSQLIVPFGTVYTDTAKQTEGYEKTVIDGVDGIINEVYTVVSENDEIVSKTLSLQKVEIEPVARVIERGVKLAKGKTAASLGIFTIPYSGRVTSGYGYRYLDGYEFHNGIDYASVIPGHSCYGEKIMAAGDGVVASGFDGGYGRRVIIEHAGGLRTLYAHMSKSYVTVGQSVVQGEEIGEIGSTGRSTGPHVHFEVRMNGVRVNPNLFLKK